MLVKYPPKERSPGFTQHYGEVAIRNVMESSPLRSIDPQHPIILADPAQSTFDWSLETSKGELEGPRVG